MMNRIVLDWVPLVRVGPFYFGKPLPTIEGITLEIGSSVPDSEYPFYSLVGEIAETSVSLEDGLVSTVACYEECIYHGRNLIGMPADSLPEFFGGEPDEVKEQEVIDSVQTVYHYYALSLMLWIEDGRVVNADCFEEIMD